MRAFLDRLVVFARTRTLTTAAVMLSVALAALCAVGCVFVGGW